MRVHMPLMGALGVSALLWAGIIMGGAQISAKFSSTHTFSGAYHASVPQGR